MGTIEVISFIAVLISLSVYMLAFLLMLVFIPGSRIKLSLIVIFFAGLLFFPPFQLINPVSLHYVKVVNNLPPEEAIETIEVLAENILRRKNGELIYFSSIYGGKQNYWSLLERGAPTSIVTDESGSARLTVYVKKRRWQIEAERAGNGRIIRLTLPLFPIEVPEYYTLNLSGELLRKDWEATGEMLYGAISKKTDPVWRQNLIDRGADVEYRNPDRLDSILHRAISYRNFQLALQLLQAGAQPDVPDKNGVRPIDQILAIYRKRASPHTSCALIVKLLKKMEAHWQATDEMLVLRSCMWLRDSSWINYLVKRGASVNARESKHGNTALHLTVIWRQFESAWTLIRLGARSDIANKAGKTPGDLIREMIKASRHFKKDRPELKKLLEAMDKGRHANPRLLYLREENPERIRLVIENGANPDFKNRKGDTPLHHAILWKNYTNALALVEAGANLRSTNKTGMTPMESLTLSADDPESSSGQQRKHLLELIRNKL